jgi:hypothetical protein
MNVVEGGEAAEQLALRALQRPRLDPVADRLPGLMPVMTS